MTPTAPAGSQFDFSEVKKHFAEWWQQRLDALNSERSAAYSAGLEQWRKLCEERGELLPRPPVPTKFVLWQNGDWYSVLLSAEPLSFTDPGPPAINNTSGQFAPGVYGGRAPNGDLIYQALPGDTTPAGTIWPPAGSVDHRGTFRKEVWPFGGWWVKIAG
jgi:hypothetical protein